ncbi:BMP family ABC transporter substrate-binding protein [Cellulomonas aerilata]|uniref:BMP family ABC transporter substrate-binding protein n=1 Tax=Cellulomonas aerilata TaxID=515326 RepID=A0A512DF89_9CELL|nr:BMP family ABC transporter substrate-binding protein [Cellulomonas aerilata]GEO35125.1 BMP family ABC transporter substrate-binding protein [Cellulomonas aerilata]
MTLSSARRTPTRRHVTSLLAGAAIAGLALSACTSATESDAGAGESSSGAAPGEGATTVGFIAVGPQDDFGYNQAVHDGIRAVAETHPDLEILEAYNIPENDQAVEALQTMVDQGATVLFATSFGHLDAAQQVAEANPDVAVLHQGGLIDDTSPENLGTYYGTVYEPVYLAGIAAGAATETGVLGFVYGYPVPQVVANINAFTLGAQSVNPDVETIAVSTTSWCDPATQADRAASLISQGADVLTQHQDCTKTIIEAAEAAGVYSVGFHADASELAPQGWLAGSEWDWTELYPSIIDTVVDGDFIGSEYDANYRGGAANGNSPFVPSTLGASVTPETKALIDAAQTELESGWTPFTGPIMGQDGATPVIPEGTALTSDDADQMDYFVAGVTGNLAG